MTQRFLTVVQRERRRVGALVAVWAFAVVSGLGFMASRASYVNVPALTVILAGAMAAGVWGVRRAFERRWALEIDAPARTCVITDNGRATEKPLDAIAPLQLGRGATGNLHPGGSSAYAAGPPQWRMARRGGRIKYLIHPDGRRDLAFLAFTDRERAQQKLEALAAEWRLPSRSLGGDVRSPDALDEPLHRRLARDPNMTRQLLLSPQSGIVARPLSPGVEFTFTRPDSSAALASALPGVLALLLLAMLFWFDVVRAAFAEPADLASRIVLGAMSPLIGLLLLGALFAMYRSRPQPVTVTREGVRLGRSCMALHHIEEVSCVADVEVRGDGRTLRIPGSWFPPENAPVFVHELKRAIVQIGPLVDAAPPN
jgi:hypothetical protein